MGWPSRFIWGPVALVALVFLAFREVSIAVGTWTCERLVTVPGCEMFQLEVLLFFGVDLGTVSFVFFNMYIYVHFWLYVYMSYMTIVFIMFCIYIYSFFVSILTWISSYVYMLYMTFMFIYTNIGVCAEIARCHVFDMPKGCWLGSMCLGQPLSVKVQQIHPS